MSDQKRPHYYIVESNNCLYLATKSQVKRNEGLYVDKVDYDRIKAENARLKAEVERLKGIILAQSSEFVCNATKREAEPLPDGWNSSIAKACDLLAEKEKEIARLKAEVERLTNLKSGADYFKAEEGKQS